MILVSPNFSVDIAFHNVLVWWKCSHLMYDHTCASGGSGPYTSKGEVYYVPYKHAGSHCIFVVVVAMFYLQRHMCANCVVFE